METNIKTRLLSQVRGELPAPGCSVWRLSGQRVCSQAPPFLEACSSDVLGSRPVARGGRGSSETRCSDGCCSLPSRCSCLPKAKEEAAESVLVAVSKLKPTHLIKAPVIGAVIRFSNPELLLQLQLLARSRIYFITAWSTAYAPVAAVVVYGTLGD